MIRIYKSKRGPDVLREKGRVACDADCRNYDGAPAGYVSGASTFSFDRKVYAADAVKRALCRAQHGKCCFCESKVLHVAYGDVEHFRPKKGYCQRPSDPLSRPGYYWLAYAWANLFFCCQICNQRHKRNLFPLLDPKARVLTHKDDLTREEPLFLDPTADDPERHVEFRRDKAVPPERQSARPGHNHRVGSQSSGSEGSAEPGLRGSRGLEATPRLAGRGGSPCGRSRG